MHLLSVDLETTGLDGNTDQILEIACVATDLEDASDKRYTFRRLVMHSAYQGNAFALAMNSAILYEIDAATKAREASPNDTSVIVTPEELLEELAKFVNSLPFYESAKKLTLTGKNVGSFDLRFLQAIPGFSDYRKIFKMGHRCMDPGPLYFRPSDKEMPDLKTCLERAGFMDQVLHRALDDAHAVLNVVRAHSTRVVHAKTGNIYDLQREVITNSTNALAGQQMRFYRNAEGRPFVREIDEFDAKFFPEGTRG